MVFDIHLHTRNYSGCSSIEAEDLVRRAEELGLDGIALTDHGIRWPEDRVEALREACGVHDLVIIPGQEITCYNGSWKREGDFLVFGVKESLGSGLSARELINLVHEQGGVVIAAHPYKRSRRGDTYYGVGDGMADLDVDCIEALHPEHDDAAIQKVRAFAESRGGIPLTFHGGGLHHPVSRPRDLRAGFRGCPPQGQGDAPLGKMRGVLSQEAPESKSQIPLIIKLYFDRSFHL
ncbi:MAG: PHP domain-containing protein [Deltaproteobacteria bacterium]|nr:PHP domain-containing protein [Deltaproteobacteria bacterium]